MPLRLLIFYIFILNYVCALEKDNLKRSDEIGKSVANSDIAASKLNLVDDEKPADCPKKHILMFHPWGTPSHMHQFKPLILGLLDAGNTVTSVFVRKAQITHRHYTEIIVRDGLVS